MDFQIVERPRIKKDHVLCLRRRGKEHEVSPSQVTHDDVDELEGAVWGKLSDKEISELMSAGSRVNQMGFHHGLTHQGQRSTCPRY